MGNRVYKLVDPPYGAAHAAGFIVIQSTSGVCFLPVFRTQIAAELFAYEYHRYVGIEHATAWTDEGQQAIALRLHRFITGELGEREPHKLPEPWRRNLSRAVNPATPEDDEDFWTVDDYDDLTYYLNHAGGDDRRTVRILEALRDLWQQAEAAARLVPQPANIDPKKTAAK